MISVPDSTGTAEQKEEESLSSIEKVSLPSPIARPYQPPVPYPQRVAWAKLPKLEPQFVHFLNVLRGFMLMSLSYKLSRKLQCI